MLYQIFTYSKSDLDVLFSVKEDITRSSPVKQANTQEVAKDSVTDLFDPLLTDSNFRMLLEIMSRNPIWLQLLKQERITIWIQRQTF